MAAQWNAFVVCDEQRVATDQRQPGGHRCLQRRDYRRVQHGHELRHVDGLDAADRHTDDQSDSLHHGQRDIQHNG